MTLVFGSSTPTAAAATHALVIGVGGYPFLERGERELVEDLEGLGQLTSPPVSARALADCLSELNNPDAPLRSVELLVSPVGTYTPPGGDPIEVEAATYDNITAAFDRWYQRCHTNKKNVALFSFCGHGLQKGTLALLPADIGSRPANPFEKAINFDQTYQAMAACRARTQCYFIDTCRVISSRSLEDPGFGGNALRRASLTNHGIRVAPKLYATGSGYRAFGEEHRVSRFTAALIGALRGGAAFRDARFPRSWVISTDRLGSAVARIIAMENTTLPPQYHQFVHPDGEMAGETVLHHLNCVPTVSATVCCIPEAAAEAAELFMEGRRQTYRRSAGVKGPWRHVVDAGTYEVGARFSEGETPRTVSVDEQWVVPPVFECNLEVG